MKLVEKYKSIPLPLKATFCFFVSSMILKGVSFFTAPLFARLMSTEEYGKLTLFVSYEHILLIFATWEVGLSPMQRGLVKYSNFKQIYRSVVILFSLLTSGVIFFVTIIFNNQFSDFTEMSFRLLLIMLIYASLYTSYSSWMTENKLAYNYKIVSIMTILVAVMQISCSLLAVKFIKPTAEIKEIFHLLPIILISLGIMVYRFKPVVLMRHKKETVCFLKFIFKFSWPLLIHSLSFLVLGQADRIMIGKMQGNSKAALYGVAYTISSVVIIVQSAMLQVMSPWIYHKIEGKKYKELRRVTNGVITVLCFVYLLFILMAPDVIILMYPKYYWNGIWCIPPIVMGVFFMFMYSLFVTVEECMDQTKYVALVSVFCSILNVILNYIGIKIWGYIACAYTTLICYILFAVGHYYFMSRITRNNLGAVKVYDIKRLLILSVIMLGIVFVITVGYESRIFRYSLIIILLGVLFLERKKILLLYYNINNKKREEKK